MSNTWTKKHTWLLLGLIIVISLAYISLYYHYIQPTKLQVEAKTVELESFKNRFASIDSQKVEEESQEADTLTSRVPAGKSANIMLQLIKENADASNVELTYITTEQQNDLQIQSNEQKIDTKNIRENSYRIEVTSKDLHSIDVFMNRITKSPRLFRFENIYIEKVDQGFILSLLVTIFYTEKSISS
ncbi:hypothetical protein [Oceanobacillus sp. 1P07AA]|uniref:hypothetical protein n=1 Tax=Oceanobacillus sp. 1P07AA TaxID=3132293 RepID=UPI0039A4D625